MKEDRNPRSPQQAEQMTTRTCVAQYAASQKAKEKKRTTQNCCRRFLASTGKAGGQWGFLEFFFLSPDTHSACPFFERGGTATCLHCGRQLWSAAGGPAGTAERATCSGEFVWKPAGWASALIRGRTEPSTADRHDTPTLSLAVTLSPPAVSFYISFFPSSFFFPLLCSPCTPFLPAGV